MLRRHSRSTQRITQAAKVKLYQVKPENWPQFQEYVRRLNYDDGKRPAIPGKLVSEKTVPIQAKPDEMVETRDRYFVGT